MAMHLPGIVLAVVLSILPWLEQINDYDLLAHDPPIISYDAWVPDRTYQPDAVEQWRPLVAGYFPYDEVDTALCLMWHESRGNTYADNPNSTARGLMQVLKGWADKFGLAYSDLYDPSVNLWISHYLWASDGWVHWSPWNRGLCRGL